MYRLVNENEILEPNDIIIMSNGNEISEGHWLHRADGIRKIKDLYGWGMSLPNSYYPVAVVRFIDSDEIILAISNYLENSIVFEDLLQLESWYTVVHDNWRQTGKEIDTNICPYSISELERELVRRYEIEAEGENPE